MKLHYETISPILLEVLVQLHQIPELQDFRLVGGTALSLQLVQLTFIIPIHLSCPLWKLTISG
jgi:hypothetical protein